MKLLCVFAFAFIGILADSPFLRAETPAALTEPQSASLMALTKAVTAGPWAWRIDSKILGYLELSENGTALYREGKAKWVWSWKPTGPAEMALTNHKGKTIILPFNRTLTEFSGPDHHGKLVVGRLHKR